MKHSPDGPYSSADYMSGTTSAIIKRLLTIIRDNLGLTVHQNKAFLDYYRAAEYTCVLVQKYEVYHGPDKVFSFNLMFNEMGVPLNRHEFVEALHRFIFEWNSWQ